MPPQIRFDDSWLVRQAKSARSTSATDAPRAASILKLAKGLDVSAAELVALLAPNQRP